MSDTPASDEIAEAATLWRLLVRRAQLTPARPAPITAMSVYCMAGLDWVNNPDKIVRRPGIFVQYKYVAKMPTPRPRIKRGRGVGVFRPMWYYMAWVCWVLPEQPEISSFSAVGCTSWMCLCSTVIQPLA